MICHINLAKGYRGGERQTELLIKELSLNRFKQKIFVRKNSQLIERLKNVDNLEIIELNKPFIFNIFKFKNCKILHAHEKKAEQLAFFVNLFLKKPYFITRRVDIKPKVNFFNKLIYKRATKVFVLSSIINKIMKDTFEVNSQIIPSVSSSLTTTSELSSLQEQYKNNFIITNIAALVHGHKGQEYIIKAANLLKDNKNLKFLLVGEGKDKEKYEKMIKEYNLDNVELVGFKKNVGDYLEISDIFLFPSLNEGLGSILIDAMEFGKVIIATNVGGIPDLIKDNYNGLLITSADELAIKEAIEKLYKNKSLRERLSKKAKAESNKYQIKNLINKYLENYKAFL